MTKPLNLGKNDIDFNDLGGIVSKHCEHCQIDIDKLDFRELLVNLVEITRLRPVPELITCLWEVNKKILSKFDALQQRLKDAEEMVSHLTSVINEQESRIPTAFEELSKEEAIEETLKRA